VFEVGDKVVCVNAKPPEHPLAVLMREIGVGIDIGLEEGRVYTIRAVVIAAGGYLQNGEKASGSVCVKLEGVVHPAGDAFLYEAARFRKVRTRRTVRP
jgi:hypothetical protein